MTRIEREKQTVCKMIELYCRHHLKQDTMSDEYQHLAEFACRRLDHCKYGEQHRAQICSRTFAQCVPDSPCKTKIRDTMKIILFAFAVLLTMTACTSNSKVATDVNEGSSEVTFEVAKNYFFKNDQQIPSSPKITTEEEFNKFFGMATVMGEDGKPTAIDFTKQFALAIVLPVTDVTTEINPVKVEAKSDTLFYTYEMKTGEKQTYSIQPVSIIILDKQYEDNEVKLISID